VCSDQPGPGRLPSIFALWHPYDGSDATIRGRPEGHGPPHYGFISSGRMGLVLRRLPRCLPEMRKVSLTVLHLSATSGRRNGGHSPPADRRHLPPTDWRIFVSPCIRWSTTDANVPQDQ
jgi:hypothetical protein